MMRYGRSVRGRDHRGDAKRTIAAEPSPCGATFPAIAPICWRISTSASILWWKRTWRRPPQNSRRGAWAAALDGRSPPPGRHVAPAVLQNRLAQQRTAAGRRPRQAQGARTALRSGWRWRRGPRPKSERPALAPSESPRHTGVGELAWRSAPRRANGRRRSCTPARIWPNVWRALIAARRGRPRPARSTSRPGAGRGGVLRRSRCGPATGGGSLRGIAIGHSRAEDPGQLHRGCLR